MRFGPPDTESITWERRIWRAALGPHSVLTLDEVVEALPAAPDQCRGWLVGNVQPFAFLGGVPLYRWGDVVDRLSGGKQAEPTTRPITTWRGVADALGVSEDTIARHRRIHGDETRTPWFADADAVAAWWRKLHEPPPLRRTGRSR